MGKNGTGHAQENKKRENPNNEIANKLGTYRRTKEKDNRRQNDVSHVPETGRDEGTYVDVWDAKWYRNVGETGKILEKGNVIEPIRRLVKQIFLGKEVDEITWNNDVKEDMKSISN